VRACARDRRRRARGRNAGRDEAGARDEPSQAASPRFRLGHPQGRSEAEDPGGRSPEGLTEAKGAVGWRLLRTGWVQNRGLAGPWARGWMRLTGHARDRGLRRAPWRARGKLSQGVHAAGRGSGHATNPFVRRA
jgi:hypothetical protein